MKCLNCGGQMVVMEECDYLYDAGGLRVQVETPIDVRRCPDCGDVEVSIPDLEGLHRAMAKCLIEQRPRLKPEELRFLRLFLGMSGVELARQMSVAPETVSRWENGQQPMGGSAEKLLRLMVVQANGFEEPTPWLADVANEEPRTEPAKKARVVGHHWELCPA